MNFPSDQATIESLHRLQEAVGQLYQTCEQRLKQAQEVLAQANSIKVSVAEIQSVHTVLEQIGGEERLNSLIAELNKTHSILVDFPDLEQRLQEKLTEYQQLNLTNQETAKKISENRLEIQEITSTNRQLSDEIKQLHQLILQSLNEFNSAEGIRFVREEMQQILAAAAQFKNEYASIEANLNASYTTTSAMLEQVRLEQQNLNSIQETREQTQAILDQIKGLSNQVNQSHQVTQEKANLVTQIASKLQNDYIIIQQQINSDQPISNNTKTLSDRVETIYAQVSKFAASLEASYTKFKEQVRLGQQTLKFQQLIRDQVSILYHKIQQEHQNFQDRLPLIEDLMRYLKKSQITLEQQIELVNKSLNHIQVNRDEIVNIFHHINEITKRIEQRHQETEHRVSRIEEIERSVINTRDDIQSMLTEMKSIAMEVKLRT